MWIPQPKQLWLPGQPKPPCDTQIDYSNPFLSQGLVGCWLFNEGGGSKAYDLCGKNHGVLGSTITRISDGLQFSSTYDDANSVITLPPLLNYQSWSGITIVTKIKYRGASGEYAGIVSNTYNGDGGWIFAQDELDGVAFGAAAGGRIMKTGAQQDQKMFLVARWAKANYQLDDLQKEYPLYPYIDDPSSNWDSYSADRVFAIGGYFRNGGWRTFKGIMYFMFIYNRALNANEIQCHYELTAGW